MNVNGLRIGSIIIDCNGSVNCVVGINKGGSIRFEDDTVCHIDKCKPIELTEELLLKWGFDKIRSCHEDAECYDYVFERIYFNMANQYTVINELRVLNGIPESIHQFQNIYFARTGEELTVTL